MTKYIFVFFTFLALQVFFMLSLGQFMWMFKFNNGGVSGSIIEQIDPAFWILLFIECLVFLALMLFKRKAS